MRYNSLNRESEANCMKSEGYLKENFRYFHLRDTAGQERDFHFHEFDKIVLLISGKVDYAVENESYALNPWDVLLVKHHCIHKAIIDKTEPYERIIIYLDGKHFERTMPGAGLMECFESADKSGNYLLVPDAGQREELRALLERYEKENQDDRYGYETMRELCIMQLLIHINRISALKETAAEDAENGYDPKIQKVLSYINENITSELNVDALAELVYLSKYHFMRLFKAQTGTTVHSYIRQKRLLHAARDIRAGVPVSQAAADAGFTDYSTFHRAFKESFGIAPGQLKK